MKVLFLTQAVLNLFKVLVNGRNQHLINNLLKFSSVESHTPCIKKINAS